MRNLQPSTLRIGQRYRPSRLNGPYDALVIGSGIGGLTTAALLSELGWRVAVLEQHYTAGGATHSYDRNGYEWDVGVHYLGDMGARTTVRRLMDFLTQGNLDWAPMDAHYDRFFIGDNVYDAVAGRDAFRENLLGHFPREAGAIDRYLELLGEVSRGMRTFTLDRTLPPWAAAVAGPWLRRRLPSSFSRTTWEVLSELTSDPELIAVLTGQWGDLGLPPKRSSFVIQALIAKHYLHGGFYPVGGAWRIADTIMPRIRATGGEVFTYARVEEVVVRDGRACGVRMVDGHEIESRCVISDAGAVNTFTRLLPARSRACTATTRLLAKVKPSIGHLGVYIGLQATAAELGLPKTNLLDLPEQRLRRHARRSSWPIRAGRSPPCTSRSPRPRTPTSSAATRAAPPSRSWRRRRTRSSRPGRTGPGASAATTTRRSRKPTAQRLLAHLYDKVPQVRGRIDYWEVSTPLSMQWFCGWERGELYGLDHDPSRLQQRWLRPRTRVPGLWLTGQDIMSCGVSGAMMGGLAAATSIAGLRKMGPVMKRVFG